MDLWCFLKNNMRAVNYKLLSLFLILCFSIGISAQNNVQATTQSSAENKDILNELNSSSPGRGDVQVFEDESITHILGRPMGPPRTIYTSADGEERFYRARGFKIQAFSGNNQRTSRNEATTKQNQISSTFPEHEAVVLFESPFWRLRVGNFESRAEAESVMQDLEKAFPSFGKEMYIVVDEVKIRVD